MRLLNTQTLEVTPFPGYVPEEVPYAILSHTWGQDEVTFEDMKNLIRARSKAGFAKIEVTCHMAIKNGLQYAWVDTCCIDKSSSAELSEAINSMFRWYRDAAVCFVYLEDFPAPDNSSPMASLRGCRWLYRGWTLQELIAPKDVMFYDQMWNLLGTKEELAEDIEAITGIDHWVLTSATPLSAVPLAKRMSWAAGRQTSRVEDRAYSLLGIFNVNLSMIYGEGAKAFFRLQEEILKSGTDLSLLAWQADTSTDYRSVLARSPDEFSGCGKVILSDDQFRFRGEVASTNKGLKINTAIQHHRQDTYILDLHCHQQEEDGRMTRVGIYLRRTLDTFFRESPHERANVARLPGSLPRSIFLASTFEPYIISTMIVDDISRRICVRFPSPSSLCRISDIRAVPEVFWEPHEHYFAISGPADFQCFVRFCVTSTACQTFAGRPVREHDESTQFILFLELMAFSRLRISLYAQTGLESSTWPPGFIDPLREIERYGPLGDPFSMSVLNPGEQGSQSISMVHGDPGNNYVISARQELRRARQPLTVRIEIRRSSYPPLYHARRAQATPAYPWEPSPPDREPEETFESPPPREMSAAPRQWETSAAPHGGSASYSTSGGSSSYSTSMSGRYVSR